MQQDNSCKFKLLCKSRFIITRKSMEDTKLFGGTVEQFVDNRESIGNKLCGLPSVNKSGTCLLHKCNIADCYGHITCKSNGLSDIYDDSLSDYCYDHTCKHYSCKNIRMGTEFCLKHKCKSCDDMIIDGYEFCKNHITQIKCYFDECSNYVTVSSASLDIVLRIQYCSLHVCDKCHSHPKFNGLTICSACKCKYRDCNNVKYDIFHYCEHHVATICCYYGRQICDAPRNGTSIYCIEHTCKLPTCQMHIYEYSDANLSPGPRDEDCGYHSHYCKIHDSLNNLCIKYCFTLDDEYICKLIETSSEQEIKWIDDFSTISDKDVMLQCIKTNMAFIAIHKVF